MKRFIILGLMLALHGSASAKDLGSEVERLSEKLSKKMTERNIKKIASVDFVDLQGQPTELGRYLAEQLSVEMVNEEGISVVDRANINNILAEHKLTLTGLVEPKNARKLGKFAGVEAILFGTVTTLDGKIVLTVKAISTETAQIVAAGKATFKKTSELQMLSTRPASSASTAAGTSSASPETLPKSSPPAARDQNDPAGKVTRRVGPLAITVDAVHPSKHGLRIFLTIESQVATWLEVTKGVLNDAAGNEMKIAGTSRTDISPGNQSNITVETMEGWGEGVPELRAPFNVSLEFGLAYGTVGAKTLSTSFHGLKF